MNSSLVIKDYLKDPILVSREDARQLQAPLRRLVRDVQERVSDSTIESVEVDFQGVAGIAPSFVDELIRVLEAVIDESSLPTSLQIVVKNPPTRLSSKFEAIARGHDLSIELGEDGSWVLSAKPAPSE